MSEPETPPIVIAMDEADFKQALVQQIPYLRAFARSLCGDRERADDLAQETLIKALRARSRFQKDSNLRAWLFTILRNHYYSECRRSVRQQDWDEDAMSAKLVVQPEQEISLAVVDLYRALQLLPDEQREALILIGAGGFGYDEAAAICGCAVGTIKSRVSRARRAIETAIKNGELPAPTDGATTQSVMDLILNEANELSAA